MINDRIAGRPEHSRALPADDGLPRPVEADALRRLEADVEEVRPRPDPARAGAIGFTMFDSPASQDNSVTVLLANERIADAPSQSLVRVESLEDGRSYLGAVVAGPFAEPDGLRADSTVLVAVVTNGGLFMPPYHGRVQVEILGERRGLALVPPRYRPLPNSPVFSLSTAETAEALRVGGDIRLGRVIGQEGVEVAIPSERKDVLPRHTAILGTTGGGKSTTVARLVQQAQAAGCAVILLDVEGEYAFLHEPTDDPAMRTALAERGLEPAGVEGARLYHLVGRETANPEHPRRTEFSLQFARPSPYVVMDILDLTDPQRQRFLQAYDLARALLRDLGIFPEPGSRMQERMALTIDEFDRGYPRLELRLLIDVVAACRLWAEKALEEFQPRHPAVQANPEPLLERTRRLKLDHPISWRALLGKLATLDRLRVFDRVERGRAEPLRYAAMLQPGTVSVIDLSDSGSPILNNLVISDLLRGVQEAQDKSYRAYESARRANRSARPPTRTLIVIEEAHEFLSAERAERMENLLEQVARIARRGRKRWLGLVFVTQLPQHLPRQLFGLVNGYVLHKITDAQVVHTLQRTVSGIDDGLWKRLSGLAPGQAIVAFPHLARPLLVAMDPAPSKLRLVE